MGCYKITPNRTLKNDLFKELSMMQGIRTYEERGTCLYSAIHYTLYTYSIPLMYTVCTVE